LGKALVIKKTFLKKILRWSIYGMLAGLLVLFSANVWVVQSTKSRVYRNWQEVPPKEVALVLGTSNKVKGGEPNPYFNHRMESAARLYLEGKVKHIIVSGDNRSQFYNEPRDMFQALRALGVPANAITLDFAGLRTLDSVVRCKEIFGQNNIIIITQPFHSYRALFISDFYGIEAAAMAAEEVPVGQGLRVRLREIVARPLAILDLYVFHKQPRHLGEKEDVEIL
jgi:SanA protein